MGKDVSSENNSMISVDNNKIYEYKGEMEEVDNNKIQHPLKRAFLAAYAETGNITSAAKLAGVDRTNHYRWISEDSEDYEVYMQAFKDAQEQAAENLESEARRRAVQGTARPVFYKGEECGTVQEYSDTLLIFLLKGAMPGKYKDNVSVDANVSITFEQLLKKALESGE
jgi:hypothetical protein